MAMLFAETNSLVGDSGWAGVGVLGLLMLWLLFWHLPAKDKQAKEASDKKDAVVAEMIALAAKERAEDSKKSKQLADEKEAVIAGLIAAAAKERTDERTMRHESNNTIQKMMADIMEAHAQDAQKDRAAFEQRSGAIVAAVDRQTLQLLGAIQNVCRFQFQHHPPVTKGE